MNPLLRVANIRSATDLHPLLLWREAYFQRPGRYLTARRDSNRNPESKSRYRTTAEIMEDLMLSLLGSLSLGGSISLTRYYSSMYFFSGKCLFEYCDPVRELKIWSQGLICGWYWHIIAVIHAKSIFSSLHQLTGWWLQF